ncbi:MAG TPA: YicC/YloC family endoribonuclease [Myxococcota bacterium]|nr:YicC/YloC family endoribonuclease [Myxococcota bacterium]
MTRRSMTGFGRADGPDGISAEVRGVNSRHLEVRARLPRELAALEGEVRAAAARHFERGQVEIGVRLPREGAFAPRLEIDLEAARSYARAAQELAHGLAKPETLEVAALLALPGVSRLREPELEAESLAAGVLETVGKACAAAAEMRAREGEALERELRSRLASIESLLKQVEARVELVRSGIRERLEKRLAALAPAVETDPARLEQEIVLQIDRMDVTEETVRLRSHLDQFRETLDAPGAVGRKLEFVLQEMGRETNTIGSKSADTELSRAVVALKTEQERLREQVLNVE